MLAVAVVETPVIEDLGPAAIEFRSRDYKYIINEGSIVNSTSSGVLFIPLPQPNELVPQIPVSQKKLIMDSLSDLASRDVLHEEARKKSVSCSHFQNGIWLASVS